MYKQVGSIQESAHNSAKPPVLKHTTGTYVCVCVGCRNGHNSVSQHVGQWADEDWFQPLLRDRSFWFQLLLALR